MAAKTCTKCNQEKPEEAFYFRKCPGGQRLLTWCKLCCKVNNAKNHAVHMQDPAYRKERAAQSAVNRTKKAWCVYRLDFADGSMYVGSTGNFVSKLGEHCRKIKAGVHHNQALRGKTLTSAKVLVLAGNREDALKLEYAAIAEARERIGAKLLNKKLRRRKEGVPLLG